MLIRRNIENTLARYINFPVIAIVGPRQSGKTTLVQYYFKNHTFLSLEKPYLRQYAREDPEGFLHAHENKHGVIIDEFQYVPELLSYIQLNVDAYNRPGYFVLTGSQNFLVNQQVTQSLAGRVGILTLLPFSLSELKSNALCADRAFDAMFSGSYPRVYTSDIPIADFYSSYIHTYLEKDVRQLTKVGNLNAFQKFLFLCAGRIAQILNLDELAMVCGVSGPTARQWLSVLEASYIVFLLQPYFKNFNKRLIKRPKLYFYDTGVACSLLGIDNAQTLAQSIFRGPLFENFIIGDVVKQFYNIGKRPPLYFWRDKNGRVEVGCLIDQQEMLLPIEIKASETISKDFFVQMRRWNTLSNTLPENNYVVYAGNERQQFSDGTVMSWRDIEQFVALR